MAPKLTRVRLTADNTLELENGEVRSLNPSHNEPVNGTYGPYKWETRTHGTHGGYETVAVNGLTVAYNPTGRESVFFWFLEKNPSGFALMSEEPIDPAQFPTVPLAQWSLAQ